METDASFAEVDLKQENVAFTVVDLKQENVAFTEVDLKQEKFEEKTEEVKKFSCDLCDKEMVYKMALQLLEGLSTACVDNTTGDIFKSPGTVAADIRKEMLDYLTERSENFVAETFLAEENADEERGDQPSDIISEFIEDFAALKRNILSRVSGWVLSDMREDKIDDFIQEMELNSFWLLDRREAIAKILLKNVDFKNEFHCNVKFKTEDELKQHRPQCGFRTVLCENEGCSATFSAAKMEQHDSVCPFKILPCEQNCPEILMRREMDRHCITVCPMKLMNCPFYSIGCQARVPSCKLQEHYSESVRSHLIHALKYIHREASDEDVAPRAAKLEQESSDRLAGAGMQGVRTFTNTVKDLDSKFGPFEFVKKEVDNVQDTDQSNSQEPPSEHKNNPDSEKHPPENLNKSDLEKNTPDNTKDLDSDKQSLEDTKNSDLDKLPSENTTKLDPEKNLLEDVKNKNFDEHPLEEAKKSDFEENPLEERENSDFEGNSREDSKNFDNDQTTSTPEKPDSSTEDPEKPNSEETLMEEQKKVDSELPPNEDFNTVEI